MRSLGTLDARLRVGSVWRGAVVPFWGRPWIAELIELRRRVTTLEAQIAQLEAAAVRPRPRPHP